MKILKIFLLNLITLGLFAELEENRALIKAAQQGDLAGVKAMIKAGATLPQKLSVMLTSCDEYLAIIKILFSLGLVPEEIEFKAEIDKDAENDINLKGGCQREIKEFIYKIKLITHKVNAAIDNFNDNKELLLYIRSININSFEFNWILNYLIRKIKNEGISSNSRQIILTLAQSVATHLGNTYTKLPEDLLEYILKTEDILPFTDFDYQFLMKDGSKENFIEMIAKSKPVKSSKPDKNKQLQFFDRVKGKLNLALIDTEYYANKFIEEQITLLRKAYPKLTADDLLRFYYPTEGNENGNLMDYLQLLANKSGVKSDDLEDRIYRLFYTI